MKNKKKVYIALASEQDKGPLEHINAILSNQHEKFYFISNLSESCINTNKYCTYKRVSSKSYFYLQIKILLILFKSKSSSLALIRHSVGLIIPYLYFIITLSRPILEVNGFTPQDLKDREKALPIRFLNFLIEFFVLHLSQKIIIVHENLIELYTKRYFLPRKKFMVIHNGINKVKLDRVQSYSNKKTLGYLGSLAQREGVDLLIAHFSKLDKDFYELLIIGGSENEYQQICTKNYSNIKYYPNMSRSKALEELQKVDICVHLRRPLTGKNDSQGMPLKMLDYLYLNKPVIASNVQSYKFIGEKDFGLLIDPYSAEEFFTAIEEIYSRREFKTLSSQAFIESNFIWEQQVHKLNMQWSNK